MPPTSDSSPFADLLVAQIRNEFTAHQQYVAAAVWYDDQDLPRLAGHFYRQAIEERNHAMMMVRYLLDRDLPAPIPGIDAVRNDFAAPIDGLRLALAQERTVTDQVEALFRAARAENDVLGEQFMLWFLKEQVEEVAEHGHARRHRRASRRRLVPDRGAPHPRDGRRRRGRPGGTRGGRGLPLSVRQG